MSKHLSYDFTAIVRSDEVRKAVMSAFGPANGRRVDVKVGSLKGLRAQIELGDKPSIVLFDVDVDDAEDLEAMDRLRRESLPVGSIVIATAEKLTTPAVRRMLRDGIEDFLPQPLSSADLSDVLGAVERKLQERDRAAQSLGSVLAFMKAAGGMGATTLAVHTACALVRRRRRKEPARKVCLIDLDLQFGSVGSWLDLDGSTIMSDLVRAPDRLDSELLRSAVQRYRDSFDVLTAPADPMPFDALRPEMVGRLVDLAQREYDHVVVDLPRALTRWTEAVLSRASSVTVVTQQSVPALLHTRKLLEMIEAEGHYALPLCLVLNRYRRQWGRTIGQRQAEKALGRAFTHVIDDEEAVVSAALDQGSSVFETRRRSRFARSVQGMAERTLRVLAEPKLAEPPAIRRRGE